MGGRKLTDKEKESIKKVLLEGVPQSLVAKRFGRNQTTISEIAQEVIGNYKSLLAEARYFCWTIVADTTDKDLIPRAVKLHDKIDRYLKYKQLNRDNLIKAAAERNP